MLAAGGNNGNADFVTAELYDPASGTWTATGSLAIGRGFLHTATLLPNGKVMVAGGGSVPAGTSAELYDPASGTWATTGNLATERDFHTATLLPNGKVLVAAGQNNSVVGLASAELYNGGQGPTPTPSQGGLSETTFTVNGSISPTIVPDSVVQFRATQTAVVAQLYVRVQAVTVLNPQEGDWTDLSDGNAGRMVFDVSSNAFVLNTTGYPLANTVKFRAISAAPGFDADSISNVVGTFNLVSSALHLGPTHLLVNGSESTSNVTPGISIHFDATQSTSASGLALRVQSSTTPAVEASWTDLPGGTLLALSGDQYAADSNQYLTGDAVYFRARSSAQDAVDSFSNEIGPFVLVADTPPSVTVVPPAGEPGSGNGQDADHPILLLTGTFSFGANTSGPRQVVNLALLYDGDTVDRFNGDHGTLQYGTNVPGDHIMEAFATDDLGGIGNALPVYVRILPRDARVCFMVTSGDWNRPENWIDLHGDNGAPGANDVAIVGASTATFSQDVTVGAISLNGGTITTGTWTLTVAIYFYIASGTLDNVNLTIGPHATLDFANDVVASISGTVTNYGRTTILGVADIVGVPHGADASAARAQGNDPALLNQVFAAIRNFGQIIFQRPRGGHTSATSNRTLNLHSLVNSGGRVISNDGASVVSHDGASVVSHDGASIRFHSTANASSTNGGTSSFDFTQTGGETDLTGLGITGSVLINGGTLTGTGIITGNLTNNGGFIAPGHSPGIIAVTGNFVQGAQGMLILEDGGAAPSLFDQLQIAGTATLGGSLDVRAINNYQPSATTFFNPLSYSSASGSFASVSSNATITLAATGALATNDPQLTQPSTGQPLNISTRMKVLSGDNVLICGFIVNGPSGSTKKVLIRGMGPSLGATRRPWHFA